MQAIYDGPFLNIHQADLRIILIQKAGFLGVKIRFGSEVASMDFGVPSITLSNGEVFESDVIFRGDGDGSIRQALLGRPIQRHHSGDQVFSVILDTEAVRRDEDLEEFIDPPTTNVWFGTEKHFIVYLLRQDHLHMVLSRAEELTELIQSRPQTVELNDLKATFDGWNPRQKTLLYTVQSAVKWKLTETPDTKTWSHPARKLALVGDSAHAMLLYLAHGAGQWFEVGVVLSTLFAKIQSKTQIPDILSIYERMRKPRAMQLKNRSTLMRDTNGMADGLLQQERDRQLLQIIPFAGYPNPWADPILQKWMFGYDAFEEAEDAWNIYLKGEWPETADFWNVAV